MRYVELFAGAGGLSRGLEAAGMTCVAHAEIEPHARAVLRRHWPDTPLHGDVTQVDWTQYAGQVDLVAGGSPCQDLSVAGKRAGLEGARSGLFYELIRAWHQTGATYCCWENVDGARSSNTGEDFASVLSAFVGGTVPVTGRWASAGVVAGPAGVAAWRVLDLQHFGPPQRRRRIFVLAARAGGCDPAEILAVTESLCGHPAPRERTRAGAARGAGAGAAFGINNDSRAEVIAEASAPLRAGQRQRRAVLAIPLQEVGKRTGVSTTDTRAGIGIGVDGDSMYTLQAGAQHGVLAFTTTQTPKVGGDVALTLEAASKSGGGQTPCVLAFHPTQDPISGEVSPAIGGTTDGMGVVQTLTVGGRDKGAGDSYDNTPITVQCITGPVTHALTHESADASEDGTGRGTPIVGVDIAPTLNMGAHTAAPGSNGQDAAEWAAITTAHAGRPRRLTPLECERLMSWPCTTRTAEVVWSESQRNHVPAETPSRSVQKSVSSAAGEESSGTVSSAANALKKSQDASALAALWLAVISSDSGALSLRSPAGEWYRHVNGVVGLSHADLRNLAVRSVLGNAVWPQCVVVGTGLGEVALRQNTMPSTHQKSGRKQRGKSGHETETASGAESVPEKTEGMFTTSHPERSSQTSSCPLTTFASCVGHAIDGFIRQATPNGSFSRFLLTIEVGWTADGVREDGTRYALSDTARYRLCGNGVGSVVAQWIGQRLMWAEAHTHRNNGASRHRADAADARRVGRDARGDG